MNKAELRKILRKRRRSLPLFNQQLAAIRLARQLQSHDFLSKKSKLAFYIANDGEINPAVAMKLARQNGATCYLPRVTPNQKLQFCVSGACANFDLNAYGIPEPVQKAGTTSSEKLDCLFLPLVAFDRLGNRLGMGGGYYDRELETLCNLSHRPLFIGLAHSTQEVPKLKADNWDIPLDMVVTEKAVQVFTSVGN